MTCRSRRLIAIDADSSPTIVQRVPGVRPAPSSALVTMFADPRGLSPLIKDHLAGGASRLAALLLPQILPVFSLVAPCQPGAALRDLVLVQRRQATCRRSSR